MHIAILAGSMNPGGAEQVALTLANAFVERGNRVDLVLASAVGELMDKISSDVTIFDLGTQRARHSVIPFRRYLKSSQPNAVLAISYEANLAAGLAVIGLSRKPRLLLSVHGSLRRLDEASLLWRLLASFASKVIYPKADYVVTVSNGVAAELISSKWVHASRLRSIHNPVIGSDFGTAVAALANHPWANDKTRPLVLAVGRLTKAKDYPTLFRAFAKVRQTSDARLLVLGDGELRAELEVLISGLGLADSVALPGYTANPLPTMMAASVFVLSSSREGFGNALVEALATGTPVISTDCPEGPREILDNGKWGKLVPVGDPDALAAAILDILKTGGVDGRERANQFTVSAATDKYLALISDGKGYDAP